MNNIKLFIIGKWKIFSNYFTIVLSVFISRFLGAIVSIMIVRDLGQVEFASFTAGFFIMTILGYSTTGLDKSFVFQYIHKKGECKKILIESYVLLKFILFIVLIVIAIIVVTFTQNIFKFNLLILLLGILFSFSYWIFTLASSLYQADQNYKKYGLLQIIYYISIFILVFLLFVLRIGTSNIYLFAYFIAIISVIVLLIPYGRITILYNKKKVSELLNLSKWLILSELCWLLFIRIDYFTVSNFLPKDILGEYAIALRLTNIVNIFISSLSVYILPKAAEIDSNRKLVLFWRKSRLLFIMLIIINIIIFLFAKYIVIILFGSKHILAPIYFKKMIIAYLPMMFIPSFQYLILKFNRKIHYFFFYLVLLLTYFIFFPLFKTIGLSQSPILAKGIGFLASLSYGIILYCYRDKNILK